MSRDMKEVREALPIIDSLDYALAVVLAWKEMMKLVKDFDVKQQPCDFQNNFF